MRIEQTAYATKRESASRPVQAATNEESETERAQATICEFQKWKEEEEAKLQKLLDEQKDAKNEGLLQMFKKMQQTKKEETLVKTSKPSDNSAMLARRLVSAGGQFEVRQIIAEASGSLAKMRMAAATSKGDEAAAARACVKRLEKVVNRAGRKIKDLDSEDLMKLQKARAEKKKQERRAEEIKQDLRKRKIARMARENAYLLETGSGIQKGGSRSTYRHRDDENVRLDGISEAAIAAEAEMIVSAEVAVTGGECAVEGGGEVAVSAGGECAGGAEEAAPVAAE